MNKADNKFIPVFILILLFSQCLSFLRLDPTSYGRLCKIVIFFLTFYVLFIKKPILGETSTYKFVLCFMLFPFLSMIPAYIIHGQSFIQTINASLFHLGYIFYFFLIAIKAKEHDVIRSFIILGILWCVIEAVQQITYPNYWFATRTDTFDHDIEIRNGIYRFNVLGKEFGLILLFYCFEKYIISKNNRAFLLGILLGLIGIYLYATRQIMAAAIISLFLGLFYMKKIKLSTVLILLSVVSIIYLNSDALFGEFINATKDIDEDYIRFIAYNFYGLEYNDNNILAVLLGNGDANRFSLYGREINSIEQDLFLYRSDIGIVGMYSLYGAIYVLSILLFFIYMFKMRKYIDVYLKMYIFLMLVTSVMMFNFGYTGHVVMTTSCIFYLIDCSIKRNMNNGVRSVSFSRYSGI